MGAERVLVLFSRFTQFYVSYPRLEIMRRMVPKTHSTLPLQVHRLSPIELIEIDLFNLGSHSTQSEVNGASSRAGLRADAFIRGSDRYRISPRLKVKYMKTET